MTNVSLFKQDGSQAGDITLNDAVFGIEPNESVVFDVILSQRASLRQGTHAVKNRSAVRGGGKKPWRQKGRGGSRAGTSRSPLWVGGGTIFGPRPREYRQDIPKKVKILAKKSALTYKVKDEQLKVVEDFNFDEPKTKQFAAMLAALKLEGKKVLLLTNGKQENIWKSGRNIDKVSVLEVNKASTYHILNNQCLLVQKSAVQVINDSYKKEVVSENA